MNAYWENRFNTWAQAPSQTEVDKIENTITAIRKAMASDIFLASKTKAFVQGSYRNRVNVCSDSDIDVGILYTGNTFYPEYPLGKTNADFGNIEGDYNYIEFKNAIGNALVNHFGSKFVNRGNKAFDIHENTYRIDADVVPLFIHRRYQENGSYICGVQIHPDKGGKIINWPERVYDDPHWPIQHYENGVIKNRATSRAFKGVVRILKKLRYELIDNGVTVANEVPGFFIECLVWNVPNYILMQETWDECLQESLAYLWTNTNQLDNCIDWGEINELKYLFRGSQRSKLDNAHNFIASVWDYVGVRQKS